MLSKSLLSKFILTQQLLCDKVNPQSDFSSVSTIKIYKRTKCSHDNVECFAHKRFEKEEFSFLLLIMMTINMLPHCPWLFVSTFCCFLLVNHSVTLAWAQLIKQFWCLILSTFAQTSVVVIRIIIATTTCRKTFFIFALLSDTN